MTTITDIIAKAARVGPELAPVIERIVREQIYRGPLDWQSSTELSKAAKEALAIYGADKELHDADTAYRKARWARVVAEKDASENPNDEFKRLALENAQRAEHSAFEHMNSIINPFTQPA